MNIDDDDEPADIDEESMFTNRRGHLNPPKNMIDREPEREPDQSYMEGNISQSKLDERGIFNEQKTI